MDVGPTIVTKKPGPGLPVVHVGLAELAERLVCSHGHQLLLVVLGRVRLAPQGGLEWVDGDIVHRREPGTGPVQRTVMAVLSHLPVKWLL